MRLAYIHQYAMKPDQAGFSRPFDYASHLHEQGISVTLVAASHDHFAGVDPHLAEHENYKTEYVEGIRYIWVRTPAYHGNTAARIKNMLVFMWRVAWLVLPERPDVVLGSSPSLFAALGAWWLSLRTRRPFVLEVRDIWPESLVALGGFSSGDIRIRVMRWMERFLYRRAKLIVSTLPNSEHYFSKVAGKKRPFLWVPNGLASLPELPDRPGRDAFVVMYSGTHGLANQLDTLLDAAKLLGDERSPQITIKLIGNGADKRRLQQRAFDEHIANVEFMDAVPKREIHTVMADADVFVVLFKDVALYRHGISANKLFDYLAMGRPVLLGSIASYHPDLETTACLRVSGGDARQLAKAIREVANMTEEERAARGREGRDFVSRNFMIGPHAERLAAALRPLA